MASALSNVVELTVSPVVAAPVLSAVFNRPPTQATLSWTCATASVDNFMLYRSVNEGPWLLYQTLAGTTFQFVDALNAGPIDTDQQYAYYLTATKGAGLSGPSNEVQSAGV